jgi:hypothetical protein
MKPNIERRANVITILAIALIAISTSPMPIRQLIAFVTLLGVVFGRDLLLKRLRTRIREGAAA